MRRWLFMTAMIVSGSSFGGTLCGSALDGSLEDRARATLLGLAYGDGFGALVEYWDPEHIRAVFGVYRELPRTIPVDEILAVRGAENLKWVRPPGLYTDDGQQALALVRAGADRGWGERQRARWRGLVVDGFAMKAWRGIGKMFVEAGRKMAVATTPHGQTGAVSAGIGAAMRIGPYGALYRDDAATLEAAVVESTLMTHADLRAAAIAFAVARAAGWLVLGVSPETIARELPGAVREVEARWERAPADWILERGFPHQVSDALARVLPHRNDRGRLAETVLRTGREVSGVAGKSPNDPFCLFGGVYAVALALADGDPGEKLTEIIHHGADTDTVAAIAGSLLGARHGSRWIPLDRVEERERLLGYATALGRPASLPDGDDHGFLRREAELTVFSDGFGIGLRRP